jgi:hypothetical protein
MKKSKNVFVSSGRRGGLARAKRLSPAKRRAIASVGGKTGGHRGGLSRAKVLSARRRAGIAAKGGEARARKLSGAERSRIARVAACARWRKRRNA